VNSDMHLESMIDRVERCNWRPTLIELIDAIEGLD
jgi:hypothetical protein